MFSQRKGRLLAVASTVSLSTFCVPRTVTGHRIVPGSLLHRLESARKNLRMPGIREGAANGNVRQPLIFRRQLQSERRPTRRRVDDGYQGVHESVERHDRCFGGVFTTERPISALGQHLMTDG
jgi:hypothetical protein